MRRDSENWCVEALRAWARVTREVVRLAVSVSFCARRSACVISERTSSVCFIDLVGWRRFRKVDDGGDVAGRAVNGLGEFRSVGLVVGGGDEAGGSSSPMISSASSGGLRSASSSPWASRS